MSKDLSPINSEHQKHGIWEEYYDNGQLENKCNYINGKRDGLYECYYDNGQLYNKCNYLNGELHGLFESYYSNGELDYKINLIHGVKTDYIEPNKDLFPIY